MHPFRSRYWTLAAALLTTAAPAFAQPEPEPGDENQITVTGRAVEAKDIVRQGRDITANEKRRDPLARFEKPLCPGVMGLRDDLAGAIVERMRFNVERIGLKLTEAGACDPNILVIFVSGLDNVMQSMFENAELERANFASLSDRERRLLKAETGPTRAWSLTSKRSADGFLLTETSNVMEIRDIGRINIGSREDIEMSLVLIDLGAIAGLNTQQLADYATMRALAETREPDRDTALSTMLELFSANGSNLTELTPFDLAYLSNLYSPPGANVAAGRRLNGLADAFQREEQAR